MEKSNIHGWILGLVIFVMGGCGLAYEYTFSKIASDLLGNSVQQWAVVIALMLFCMGVGAEIQRFIQPRMVLPALLYSQVALALLGGFGPLLLLLAFSSFPLQFGLIHYGSICSMGILIGFEIPLITRLNEDYSQDIRSNLARVLKMDYIGALVGALLWVFLLPLFFTLHQIAYILGFISLFATLLCWCFFKNRLTTPLFTLVAIFAAAIGLGAGFSQSDKWALFAEQKLYRDQIVLSETTPYQHIVVTQSRFGTMRCYINGHIQFSSDDEFIYHENLVHPAMSMVRAPERVLILGGGDGLALREVLKYPSVAEVVLVDLDPAMTDLASNHVLFSQLNDNAFSSPKVKRVHDSGLSKGENYTLEFPNQRRLAESSLPKNPPSLYVLNIDAAAYVRQARGEFDVVICDFPDPSSPELAKLYSLAFYAELKKLLKPDGFIVQQSTSPFRAKEAFLCIGRTMEAAQLVAVPYHDHVPSFGEWGWWLAGHPSIYPESQIRKRLSSIDKLPEDIRYLTPELIQSSLHFGRENLLSSETDITTISNTAVLQHYLNGWLE